MVCPIWSQLVSKWFPIGNFPIGLKWCFPFDPKWYVPNWYRDGFQLVTSQLVWNGAFHLIPIGSKWNKPFHPKWCVPFDPNWYLMVSIWKKLPFDLKWFFPFDLKWFFPFDPNWCPIGLQMEENHFIPNGCPISSQLVSKWFPNGKANLFWNGVSHSISTGVEMKNAFEKHSRVVLGKKNILIWQ